MARPPLEIDDLRVDRSGSTAIQDLTLALEAGEVFGLVGPNGSGKSTLLNAIAGLVPPTQGTVRLAGHDVFEEPRLARAHLGYMPENPPLIEDLTVGEFLTLFASAYGMPRSVRGWRIDGVLHRTALVEVRDVLTCELSRGLRQRVFLAKTLLHDPAVVVLDEPSSDLDPEARSQLAAILRGLGESGKAVLVSSRLLRGTRTTCTRLGILTLGQMVASGPVEMVLAQVEPQQVLRLRVLDPDPRLLAWLIARPGVLGPQASGREATFHLEGGERRVTELLADLLQGGFRPVELAIDEGGLERAQGDSRRSA